MIPLREPHLELFNESGYDIPLNLRAAKKCLVEVSRQESCSFGMLEIVYVDEETIRRINLEHLDHDYATDIITFRYDEEQTRINIEATIYCCAPLILHHSLEYNESKENEFIRVLIHGLLHLAGYGDTNKNERQEMRERENFYLSLLGK